MLTPQYPLSVFIGWQLQAAVLDATRLVQGGLEEEEARGPPQLHLLAPPSLPSISWNVPKLWGTDGRGS